MTLTKTDYETGLKKYTQAVTDAENDKEFAMLIVKALEEKIKELEAIENGE